MVYLDVWERHVTSLQEKGIREVALGINEPDTAARAQVVWQVKIMKPDEIKNHDELWDDIQVYIREKRKR